MGAQWSFEANGPRNALYDVLLEVLRFVDWEDRAAVFAVSRYYREIGQLESTWRWMCGRLTAEHSLVLPRSNWCASWRSLFLELFPRRFRFSTGEVGDAMQFRIDVCVRFRPPSGLSITGEDEDEDGERSRKVVIPLHQRIRMVKARHGCTSAEAMRYVWGAPAGTAAPPDPWAEAHVVEDEAGDDACGELATPPGSPARGRGSGPSSPGKSPKRSPGCSNAENVDPQSPLQAGLGPKPGILAVHPKSVLVCAPSVGLRQFRFNNVLNQTTTQTEVYGKCSELITEFINGVNGTVLCFGQTGSGKTYTMFGPSTRTATSLSVSPQSGVVARACLDVFRAMEDRRRQGFEVELAVSYIEVFGSALLDLLRQGAAVGNWRGVAVRSMLEGGANVTVKTLADVEALLAKGEQNKRYAATQMNLRSSRAHTIFTLSLRQRIPGRDLTVTSKLNFADLGGSERIKKSNVEGERRGEAVQINLGLLALKNCISALHRGRSHVPYGDSRLTLLLQDALGGNSKTMVIVNGYTDSQHVVETLEALRFGAKCNRVLNEGQMDLAADDALRAMDEELQLLEEQIRSKERWENRIVEREDLDGIERLTVTVPVGAEAERERFEELLAARRNLVGV
eukprot:m.208550 g.208550  ORF g.208550 m.208550 type:complete len:624 (+) comp10717_c1_seq1:431-2302(+)